MGGGREGEGTKAVIAYNARREAASGQVGGPLFGNSSPSKGRKEKEKGDGRSFPAFPESTLETRLDRVGGRSH